MTAGRTNMCAITVRVLGVRTVTAISFRGGLFGAVRAAVTRPSDLPWSG